MSKITILIMLGLCLLVSACNAVPPGSTPSPTAAPETTPLPTDTPQPSPTATAVLPEIVLLAPPGADPLLVEQMQTRLADFAAKLGFSFQVSPGLNGTDLSPQVKLVVVLPPEPGVAALAETAPETQFLAVSIPGVVAGGNLSTVGANGQRADQVAFTAGYLAAAMTPDWRVGVVSALETPAGNSARLGFTNGVYYLCGLCRSAYPPFPLTGYPVVVQLAPGAGQAEWQSAVNDFLTWQVGSVYVAPEVAEDGLLEELANAGIHIIGTDPPDLAVRENWVASIQSGDAVEAALDLLPELLEGNGGVQVDLPLVLGEVNPDLLSPGRQGLVEEMLTDLLEGYIDTGVDPATGESRFSE